MVSVMTNLLILFSFFSICPRKARLRFATLLPFKWFGHAHQNPKDVLHYMLSGSEIKVISAQKGPQRSMP